MNDTIAKALGVSPIMSENEEEKKPIATKKVTIIENPANGSQDEVSNDFEMARENLINIIQNGSDAIDTLADLANQSQDADAFAALSSLMNTLVNANKQLLEIQKRIREIEREDGHHADKQVTNNLFVGTSDQLLKLIKGET